MRFRVLLFTVLSASAAMLACSSDETKPPLAAVTTDPPVLGGGAQSSADGGTSTGTTDAGACSSLAIGPTAVIQNGVNDVLPTGTGGTIPNGIYDLTLDDKYLGLSGLGLTGVSVTSTISIDGNAFERVETQVTIATNAVSGPIYSSGTLTISGVNGVIGLTCPLATSSSISYTVSTDSTTVIFYDSSTNEGRTYRLR